MRVKLIAVAAALCLLAALLGGCSQVQPSSSSSSSSNHDNAQPAVETREAPAQPEEQNRHHDSSISAVSEDMRLEEHGGIAVDVPSSWHMVDAAADMPFIEGTEAEALGLADEDGPLVVISSEPTDELVDDAIGSARFALGRVPLRMQARNQEWTYLDDVEVDRVHYVRDYPACNTAYKVEDPDGRVYQVECMGIAAPGNIVYVATVCPSEGLDEYADMLGNMLHGVRPSEQNVSRELGSDRLHFGIRYRMPVDFVQEPYVDQPKGQGCALAVYGPSYGGGVKLSVQSDYPLGEPGDDPASPDEILQELESQSERLPDAESPGEDEFIGLVDDGEVDVAGVRSWETVYDYKTGDGAAMRAFQASMAFEGFSLSLRLECPVGAADDYSGVFSAVLDGVSVVPDPGDGFDIADPMVPSASKGAKGVFFGVARVEVDGNGRECAYLELPRKAVIYGELGYSKQTTRLKMDEPTAEDGLVDDFRSHEGQQVVVVGVPREFDDWPDRYGHYQIDSARLVAVEQGSPQASAPEDAAATAIGFATDLLGPAELRDGEVVNKEPDAFRKYVDPSSELYEFGDDEEEPSVVFQGGSLKIVADATLVRSIGNVYFVDLDCRTYTGPGNRMYQNATQLAIVLNANGLVQEAYYC